MQLSKRWLKKLNTPFFNQRFNNRVECFLDDFLRLELGQPDLLRNRFYDLFFGHGEAPFEAVEESLNLSQVYMP